MSALRIRRYRTVLDSGFQSLALIPDSLSYILDSKTQDPKFHEQNFQDSISKKISGIPDLGSLYGARLGLLTNPITVVFLLKMSSITRNQHFKMGKEGPTVYFFVDLYLSVMAKNSTRNHQIMPLRAYCEEGFWIKSGRRKGLCHTQ